MEHGGRVHYIYTIGYNEIKFRRKELDSKTNKWVTTDKWNYKPKSSGSYYYDFCEFVDKLAKLAFDPEYDRNNYIYDAPEMYLKFGCYDLEYKVLSTGLNSAHGVFYEVENRITRFVSKIEKEYHKEKEQEYKKLNKA